MGSSAQAVLGARSVARSRSPFYLLFSLLLLAIVVTGFAPTFFLNAFMAKKPLPAHVFLHGVIGTSWYVLLLVQSALVYVRQTALHRRLGSVGMWLALGIFAATAVAAVLVFPIRLAAGMPLAEVESVLKIGRSAQMVRDIGAVAGFAGYIYLALRWRRDVETHKRLMMLGSIILSAAAIGRLGWVVAGLVPGELMPIVVLFPLLGLLMINDWLSLGRVHRATAYGGLGLVAIFAILSVAVPALIA
ncbi:MAG: hypothetical protein J7485_13580 [Sphingobium sp.]|nr:hypothetical protein [Sphingobium sp.]